MWNKVDVGDVIASYYDYQCVVKTFLLLCSALAYLTQSYLSKNLSINSIIILNVYLIVVGTLINSSYFGVK